MPRPDPRVPIPGTTNFRDVAGYPAAGGVVAPGRLYRAEVIVAGDGGMQHGCFLPEHAGAYAALGIRTVVDLRAEHEVGAARSAWGEATGAEVIALPIAEGGEGTDTNYVRRLVAGEMASFGPADMAEFYRATLDRRATTFAAAARLLATPARLPVLVHCAAGKDRTGLLVALVLEVLGTPRAVTVEDYALTGVYRPNRVQAYAERFGAAGVDLEDVRVLFETPASAMEAALAHLDERYGGAAGYLRDAGGLTDAELDAVRANLVEPHPVPADGERA